MASNNEPLQVGDADIEEDTMESDLPSEADLREMLDVTVLVANDHDRVKRLWHMFKGPGLSPDQRRDTAQHIVRDLTQHTAAEQEVLYPAMRKMDPLKDQVHHALSEHASLVVLMCDVLAVAADDPAALVQKMEQLMEVFLEHIHEEEHGALSHMRDFLPPEQLRELGRHFEKARLHATTDPHDLRVEGEEGLEGEEDEELEEEEGAGGEGEEDVVELVMNAHDAVKRLFHEFRDPQMDEESRVVLSEALVEELTATTAAEQEVLYPVLREKLGDQYVEHALSVDASLVSIMRDMTNIDQRKDAGAYTSKMNSLMQVYQQHMHDEEHLGLATLRQMLAPEQLRELGQKYSSAVAAAPKEPQNLGMNAEGPSIDTKAAPDQAAGVTAAT